MTALGTVALGLALVLLDLRISGFDVVPDVLGWLLAIGGLGRLAPLAARFRTARGWAVGCAVLSLADLVQPQVTTTGPDGSTTTAAASPDGLLGWVVAGYGVAAVVVAVLVSLAVRDVARRHGDTRLAERFTTFATLHVALGAVLLAGTAVALVTGVEGTLRPQGGAAALTVGFVLAAVAVEVCFLLALASAAGRRPTAGEVVA